MFSFAPIRKLLLVSGSYYKKNKVWNLETNECIKTLIGHNGIICGLDVTLNGDLISCLDDNKLKYEILK